MIDNEVALEYWQNKYLELEDDRNSWKAEALAARGLLLADGDTESPEDCSFCYKQWVKNKEAYTAARAANDKENMNAKH